jgi:hypothetical protein
VRIAGHAVGEDLCHQLVPPFRNGDRQPVGGGRLVQLGCPAATARLVRRGLVPRGQQARVDEFVEVEGGEPARHAGRLGGLLAAHAATLPAHVLVQCAPRPVGECGDHCEPVDHPDQIITSARC